MDIATHERLAMERDLLREKLLPRRVDLKQKPTILEGSRSIQLSYRGKGQKVTEIRGLAELERSEARSSRP